MSSARKRPCRLPLDWLDEAAPTRLRVTRPPHHRDGGFQNNHGDFEPKSLADVLRWRWNAARQGLPKRPAAPIPTQSADLAFIRTNTDPAVTWIGHATVLAIEAGKTILLGGTEFPRLADAAGISVVAG